MCDYSLEAVKSRAAVKGEKLITTNFGLGTSGFAPALGDPSPDRVAVCLLPGTELAFDAPVQKRQALFGAFEVTTIPHQVARFAKINPDNPRTHHDGLEFPDTFGVPPVLLTHLVEGQTATVIQMPVDELGKALEEQTWGSKIAITTPEYTD